MKHKIVLAFLFVSACVGSSDDEQALDLSEAYGCYAANGVPMIKISAKGMEIPELQYKYKKTELVERMNGKLWIYTTPAYGIVKQSDGNHVFDYIYEDDEINKAGYYTRFWQENGVKYLENYSYPEGPLFLYKTKDCE